jgi:quercetin dioxygenase-like cupin family protein
MDRAKFEERLRREGFGEVVTGSIEANVHRPEHSHDYDVLAMVLDGDITMTCHGETRTYRAGDSFAMAAGLPHVELAGAKGVTYVAGRRREG